MHGRRSDKKSSLQVCFNGQLLSVQIRAGHRFPWTIFDGSDQHHRRYNLCEPLPVLIKLDESMMESRSAIQVLGISPDRWSWWGLGAEGGQGWNQFTRMFFNITNITNNYNLFRFLALTLLHHNVAWRLATSLFRFSFFCIFEMPTFWDYFDSFLL